MASFKMSLEVNEEGTFLTIMNPPANATQVRDSIESELKKYAVRYIDQAAVNRLAAGAGSLRREKISNVTASTPFDEEIILEVDQDALNAYIVFIPPINGGRLMDENEIRLFLDNKGVVYDIDNIVLNEMINKRAYNERYKIAVGKAPVKGIDGKLEFLFDNSPNNRLKPVILENENVDYYNVKNFELVEKGQVLVRIHPAGAGTDGIDIYGKIIKSKAGRQTPKIILGKNVSLSKDAAQIIAEASGQILYSGNRLSVSEVLEITGDVGPATGNIDFAGSVKVGGGLKSGYSIKAGGNVELHGVCEGDAIYAQGDVLISGGLPGMKKSCILAGENVSARFIANAEVDAQGNIYTESIRQSVVRANGYIELAGKRASVSGGRVFAKKGITAKTIGSPMAIATELYVGVDYETYEKYSADMKQYNEIKKQYEKAGKDIQYLEKLSLTDGLSEEKRQSYMRLKYTKASLSKQLSKMKPIIADLVKKLNSGTHTGFVRSDMVHSGVRIQIGNAVMLVRDDIAGVQFTNEDGAVAVNPI